MLAHAQELLIAASLFGFFMAWAVGANDVANAMGTSVGSGALTIRQAIIVAAIFEALGALLASGHVTNTIRSEIINIYALNQTPELIAYGMLAALLACGSWLLVATRYGWPVSTTHGIVGAVLGFGFVCLGPENVHWGVVGNIFLSWVLTPLIAALGAYLIFRSVQVFILNAEDPVRRAQLGIPLYMLVVSLVVLSSVFVSGLKAIDIHMPALAAWSWVCTLSLVCVAIGSLILKYQGLNEHLESHQISCSIERLFGLLAIVTACAMAFAHGSNDVANAIGPLATIVSLVENGGKLNPGSMGAVPYWISILGAVGIVSGLALYGYRVIATIGTKITRLTPSRGFAAQLATSATVLASSSLGLPVSTTQTLVGAVLGVGLAGGISALNLGVIRNIFLSWVVTLPAGAGLAIVYFEVIKWVFSR